MVKTGRRPEVVRYETREMVNNRVRSRSAGIHIEMALIRDYYDHLAGGDDAYQAYRSVG